MKMIWVVENIMMAIGNKVGNIPDSSNIRNSTIDSVSVCVVVGCQHHQNGNKVGDTQIRQFDLYSEVQKISLSLNFFNKK